MSIRLGDSIIARANMDFSDVTALLTETNELINNIIDGGDVNTTNITDALTENTGVINSSISDASNKIISAVQRTVSPDLSTTNNLLQTIIDVTDNIGSKLLNTSYIDLTSTNNSLQTCIRQLSNMIEILSSRDSYYTQVITHLESIDAKLT